MSEPETTYTIASVDAALTLLEALAQSEQDWQYITDLSQRLAMTKNHVFRILSTLKARGYVEYDSTTRGYRLGPSLFRLGHRARSQMNVYQAAQPYLKSLAQATQEVAHLIVRRGLSAVCVGHQESNRRLLVSDQIGQPIPLHIGASPKVLIAFLPESERDAILRQLSYERFTDLTITNRTEFIKMLDRIVDTRIAVDHGDFERDVCAVGAPVFDDAGQVVAGVTVTCPRTRFDSESETRISAEVKRAAQDISQAIGYYHS